MAYFKLNYKDGKIIEAKAYLEQSPYIHHHYFDAYETSCDFPDHEALERTAQFIETYESEKGMTLSVDTCFSPLRAFMGGEDPK